MSSDHLLERKIGLQTKWTHMTHMSAMSQKTAFYHLKNISPFVPNLKKKKKVQETPGEWLIFVKEGRVLKHDI